MSLKLKEERVSTDKIIRLLSQSADKQFACAPDIKDACLQSVAADRLKELDTAYNELADEMHEVRERVSEMGKIKTCISERELEGKIRSTTMDCFGDMIVAVQKAGGSCESFTWDALKRMSAACFLNTLASNMKITFSPLKEEK